jgi:hypothetical protein
MYEDYERTGNGKPLRYVQVELVPVTVLRVLNVSYILELVHNCR